MPQCFRKRCRSVLGNGATVFDETVPQCFRKRFHSVLGNGTTVFDETVPQCFWKRCHSVLGNGAKVPSSLLIYGYGFSIINWLNK